MTVRPARALRRALALSVATAAGLLGAVAVAAPAQAAVLGPVAVTPTSGNDATPFGGTTADGCPDGTLASSFWILGSDLDFDEGEGSLGATNSESGAGPQEFSGATIANLKTVSAGSFASSGTYTIRLICEDETGITDTWDATMQYIAGGAGAWTITTAVADRSTTTTLAAAPTTVVAGADVLLTADVTPTSGDDDPAGTVAFRNGATTVGTAPVGPNGVATLTTDDLPVGTSTLTAVFTAGAGFTGSTSSPVSVTVSAAPTTSAPTTSAPTTSAPTDSGSPSEQPSLTATGVTSTDGGGVLGSGAENGGGGAGGVLASTGAEVVASVLAAAVLVALGVLLVAHARRNGWQRRGTHRA